MANPSTDISLTRPTIVTIKRSFGMLAELNRGEPSQCPRFRPRSRRCPNDHWRWRRPLAALHWLPPRAERQHANHIVYSSPRGQPAREHDIAGIAFDRDHFLHRGRLRAGTAKRKHHGLRLSAQGNRRREVITLAQPNRAAAGSGRDQQLALKYLA